MVLMNDIRPYVLIWRVSREWLQFILMFFLSSPQQPPSLSLLLLVFLAAWLKGEVDLQDSDGSLQSSSDPVDMSYLADKQSGGIS